MVFFFLDGVGIGDASESNPFFAAGTTFLPFYKGNNGLPDGTPVKPIDPLLGVDGIPQSATGQTSLYTGENVPALLTEHKGSYPNRPMRKLIKEKNILLRLRKKDLNAVFINAYPYHTHLFTNESVSILEDGSFQFSDEYPRLFKRRLSVTTCMMIANRLIPFGERDIMEENTIYQDYSNSSLILQVEAAKKAGEFPGDVEEVALPRFTPEKAAEILYNVSRKHDFVLYEYFQTDIYAHRSTFDERVRLIRDLDRLMGRLVSLMNKEEDTLLVTSDHGNIEAGGTRAHTRNPVPLVVWGKGERELRTGIDSLVDVTPAVLKFFGKSIEKNNIKN